MNFRAHRTLVFLAILVLWGADGALPQDEFWTYSNGGNVAVTLDDPGRARNQEDLSFEWQLDADLSQALADLGESADLELACRAFAELDGEPVDGVPFTFFPDFGLADLLDGPQTRRRRTGMGGEAFATWQADLSDPEVVNAWEELRGWVAGTIAPKSRAMIDSYGGSCDLRLSTGCVPDVTTLCLNNDRFQVTVDWSDFSGPQGSAPAVGSTDDSGSFRFFEGDQWELLVKVLDQCSYDSHFWVFYGSNTDVGYTLTVTDTLAGVVNVYDNPLGRASPAITDTQAFATCP